MANKSYTISIAIFRFHEVLPDENGNYDEDDDGVEYLGHIYPGNFEKLRDLDPIVHKWIEENRSKYSEEEFKEIQIQITYQQEVRSLFFSTPTLTYNYKSYNLANYDEESKGEEF